MARSSAPREQWPPTVTEARRSGMGTCEGMRATAVAHGRTGPSRGAVVWARAGGQRASQPGELP
eukprot:332055-Prymnesium_polylepis.1